jgi:hypothetical protein
MAIEPAFAVPDQVARLLGALLNRTVTVKKGNAIRLGKNWQLLSTFVKMVRWAHSVSAILGQLPVPEQR